VERRRGRVTLEFDNLSDAYAIVEIYECGSVDQRTYHEACRYALEYFRKKYGKNSFWFRELFACMQSNEWENTFEIRCLIHAEVIGCPHDDCGKYKEMSLLKKCQHCSYIEGVERKWKMKTSV